MKNHTDFAHPNLVHLSSLFLCFLVAISLSGQNSLHEFLRQARTYEGQGNYAAAEREYEQARRLAPNDLEVLKRLGILYQTESKFPQSVDAFIRVLASHSQYPQVNFYLGVSYLGLNENAKAIESFHRELATPHPHPRCRYYLAVAYEGQGQINAAIEQLNDLVSANPGDLDALYQLARLYKNASFQAMDMLRKEGPDSFQLHALMGEIYADEERYADSIREYRAALTKRPNATGIHYSLGVDYWAQHDNDNARKEFIIALKEDPSNSLIHLYLGDIARREGHYDEALSDLRIAASRQPRLAMAHRLLGECYANLGRLQEAKTELTTSEQLNPGDPQTHYLLARVYQQSHDMNASQREMGLFRKLSSPRKAKPQK